MEALTTVVLETVLPGAISAIIAAVVSYFVAAGKVRLEMRSRIDENLQEVRTELYRVLWKKTELLPQWPKNTDATYENLAELSRGLRDWYFDQGGIYLSSKSRKAYGRVQKALTKVTRTEQSGPLTRKDYDEVRKKCSILRTELTKDLLSRRRAF